MGDKKEDRSVALRKWLSFPWLEDDFWGTDISHQKGLSVSEDTDHVYVEAHLPGLKPEDIEVTFEKGVLWIKGEKSEEEEDKQRKYYRKASTTFSYRIDVPGFINEKEEPEALYKDGVMKVSFKKSPGSDSKKIRVKSS